MRTANIGLYSNDPPAIDAFFGADPESFGVSSAIAEPLIVINSQQGVVPALATSWEQTSPVSLEMTLREGVRFHNGEPFDADSVVATFHHHHHPTPSTLVPLLRSMAQVERLESHRIRITTREPDAMILRRLLLFLIYPKGLLELQGREGMRQHPIGTGAWRFVHWHRGHEILLTRNFDHWIGTSTLDRIRLPIVRKKEWISGLASGTLDVVLDLDGHDSIRASHLEGIEVMRRNAAISERFLLANRGPLADVRVRRALNHAIKRPLITKVALHGFGRVQHGFTPPECIGSNPDIPQYRYSPEIASALLAEAGYSRGFTLRGLVSEGSTEVFLAVQEFLRRIGVQLKAGFVPRSEWVRQMHVANHSESRGRYDFSVCELDNPLLDGLFPHENFLFSSGIFSLTRSEEYDALLSKALLDVHTDSRENRHDSRCELEHYVNDQALILFTAEHSIHAAWHSGTKIDMPASGHFDTQFWWTIDVPEPVGYPLRPRPTPPFKDAEALTVAISHPGTFFLPPKYRFSEDWAENIWQLLATTEERWHLSHQPMLQELVRQAESGSQLRNILGSTKRMAIVGYSLEGERTFANAGFREMFHPSVKELSDFFAVPSWKEIESEIHRSGAWLGPVSLKPNAYTKDTPSRLYLTATSSIDDEGISAGWTLVFSDFSGEEERIRNQAIHTILDHVPYGLFIVDRDGCLREGVSRACQRLFPRTRSFSGARIGEVLDVDVRTDLTLQLSIEQAFERFLPDEVALEQIPMQIEGHGSVFSLSASIIENEDDGDVDGLLFTCTDISHVIEAENQAKEMYGVLQVLRFRDRFQDFIRDFAAQMAAMLEDPGSMQWQVRVRRLLHTAKGVFGQFGLHGLQQTIHDIEDVASIEPEHLRRVRSTLEEILTKHAEIWRISLLDDTPRFELEGTLLDRFDAQMSKASSLSEAQAIAAQLSESIRCKRASILLGPLEAGITQLADRRGKQIHIEIRGRDLMVPRRLLPIFDALGHIARNAVDHGIELPEDRGTKTPWATISIEVARDSSGWRLSVEDDGQGIDSQLLGRRAIELGLITEEALKTMTEEDQQTLLFSDGLSTAEVVSESSGRGVGMASVQAAVRDLGGEIRLRSQLGRGTRFDLFIPDVPAPFSQPSAPSLSSNRDRSTLHGL